MSSSEKMIAIKVALSYFKIAIITAFVIYAKERLFA